MEEPTSSVREPREPYQAPQLKEIGTVAELTKGGGTDAPEGQGSTFPVGPPSDRNLKRDFAEVDPREVLERVAELPVTTWSYKANVPTVRHIGPMAQDFAAAFEVGDDDRHIHPVDASGVALAAIKALAEIVEEQRGEIEELRAALTVSASSE